MSITTKLTFNVEINIAFIVFCGTFVPRYLQTFYLQIRLFTFEKNVKIDNFSVNNGLFICEFKIRGPE